MSMKSTLSQTIMAWLIQTLLFQPQYTPRRQRHTRAHRTLLKEVSCEDCITHIRQWYIREALCSTLTYQTNGCIMWSGLPCYGNTFGITSILCTLYSCSPHASFRFFQMPYEHMSVDNRWAYGIEHRPSLLQRYMHGEDMIFTPHMLNQS